MFKNMDSKRMIGILLALVVVTALFIGGSIARYVTSTSSEDEARVAIWGINEGGTNMDLFNNVYEMPDGTVIAESNGGVNDKIIAPGTSNNSEFKILTASSVRPEVMYEVSINLDDSEMPDEIKNHPGIQWKLDDGEYGTWEELKLSLYNLVGNDTGVAVFGPGEVHNELANGVIHKIYWQWLLDSGYDEEDTRLGNLAASGTPITAKVVVEMTAQQVDVDATGMLEGNGSIYNTNDPQPLTFRADADYSTFKDVEINGTTLNPNNYTTADGSIKVTLKKEYLETLAVDDYKITINTTDGKAIESKFTVTDNTMIVHNDIIPENGTYYKNSTYPHVGQYPLATIYNSGTEFPQLETGDIYVYNGYEYRYNMEYGIEERWIINEELNGWGVKVLDTTKDKYDAILTSINDKNIVSVDYTFQFCENLLISPILPNKVISMNSTFVGCTSLTEPPVIPNGVIDLSNAFESCASLTVAPTIPNSVKAMSLTFASTSIIEMPIIPNSVTHIDAAFMNCSKLEKASTIPSSVEVMVYTFRNCTNLTGVIEINANLTAIMGAFEDTVKPITLTGSSTMLNELAATSSNNNITVISNN